MREKGKRNNDCDKRVQSQTCLSYDEGSNNHMINLSIILMYYWETLQHPVSSCALQNKNIPTFF